jgi:aryl-alcohol dehydrogenase-like predicted oxidoreductase
MKYVTLGKCEPRVSRIASGTWQLGGDWGARSSDFRGANNEYNLKRVNERSEIAAKELGVTVARLSTRVDVGQPVDARRERWIS